MTAVMPPLGSTSSFRKTVTETDIGLFAGITGDFAPHHIDEEYMRERPQRRRIAHGILILGIASTAASSLCEREGLVAVSAGYDRLRFLQPVYIGDTVEARYEVMRVDSGRGRVYADVRVTTQDDVLCLVTTHLLHCY